MSTQPMDLGNGLTDQQASPPPPQQNVQAPPVHTGGLFHSVLSALGGASTPSYSVDDSGKMQTTQTQNTPGTQWKHIIAGALTGMAAGAQAGSESRPGAQGWAGAGAGFQAVQAHNQQQDLLKRAQAQQEFNTKQQKMVQDANIAHLNALTVKTNEDIKNAGIEASDKSIDRFNAMQGLISSDPNNREVFSAPDLKGIMDATKVDPKLFQLNNTGALRVVRDPSGGYRAFEVHPAWSEAKTDKPITLHQPVFENGKITHKTVELPAGSISNAVALSLGQTFQNQENDMNLKKFTQDQENQRAREGHATTIAAAKIGAESRENVADTKNHSKLSTDEQRRADLANNMNENLDALEDIVKRRPDLFGPIAGRMTQAKGAMGTSDPDVAKLSAIKEQLGMAMIGAHAMRNAQHVEAAANAIIGGYKNQPQAVLAAIGAARNSLSTFNPEAAKTGVGKTTQQFSHTATDAKGNKIGWDGKQWVPIQ